MPPGTKKAWHVHREVEQELRHALTTGTELRVYYQPQVAPGGSIVGLEALVRWQSEKRGLISPDRFIPIAEETGLIAPLGEWVLSEAARAARQWPGLSVAVNLSPVQFRSLTLAETVIGIVERSGCSPKQIELEVTESLLLADDEVCRVALERLRSAGFRIALDDFGTGYSSLSYLRRFAVDKIKIDRSFTKNLGQEDDSAVIITSVVMLAHAMGLTVTAEGVETQDQMDFLSMIGCEEMQGFLFSRALPEEEIAKLVATGARLHGVREEKEPQGFAPVI